MPDPARRLRPGDAWHIPPANDCRFNQPQGQWIKRRHADEHRCQLPELNQGLHDHLADGDQWQCHHCHTIWTVRPAPARAGQLLTRWTFEAERA